MKHTAALLLLSTTVAHFATATPASGYDSTTNSGIYSKCNGEFLLSIDNDSEGVTLSTLAANDNNNAMVRVLYLDGQKLPSDVQCGEDNFRCKNPLTIKNTLLNSTIMFFPLCNALLLADFVLNDTGVILEEHHLINFTRFNCTPVTSVKILYSVYTICLNIDRSYVGLFEIQLNPESLIRTSVIGPLAQNYFSIQSSSQISEFKYIELYNFHFIYFAYAKYLYYFDPLNYVLNYAGNFHPNCTSVKELVYIGGNTLIGYCREGATIYFDLNYESWTFYQPYSSYGRSFVCPDQDKRLVVFSEGSYAQFNDVSESKTIRLELIGENFVSGECFGDSSGFYFVYVDQREGTFIINLTTFNFTQLSTQPCFAVDGIVKCKPFQVIDNQYLIVQQWGNPENLTDSNNNTVLQTVVFNTQNNFQIATTIISNEINESLSLVSVIPNSIKSCPNTATTVETTVQSLTTSTDSATAIPTEITDHETTVEVHASTKLIPAPSVSSEVTLAISIAVGGLVLIMLLIVSATLILTVFIIRHSENKTNSESR